MQQPKKMTPAHHQTLKNQRVLAYSMLLHFVPLSLDLRLACLSADHKCCPRYIIRVGHVIWARIYLEEQDLELWFILLCYVAFFFDYHRLAIIRACINCILVWWGMKLIKSKKVQLLLNYFVQSHYAHNQTDLYTFG